MQVSYAFLNFAIKQFNYILLFVKSLAHYAKGTSLYLNQYGHLTGDNNRLNWLYIPGFSIFQPLSQVLFHHSLTVLVRYRYLNIFTSEDGAPFNIHNILVMGRITYIRLKQQNFTNSVITIPLKNKNNKRVHSFDFYTVGKQTHTGMHLL